MRTHDSNRLITLNTIVTLAILADFSNDDLNMVIDHIFRLVKQSFQRLLTGRQKLIFNPVILEVIVAAPLPVPG